MQPYDPSKYVLSFSGIQITGFADGEFITAALKEDTFSLVVGGQGDVTRVQNRNVSGSVKFILQNTADANDLLSAIAIADRKLGNGVGTLQLQLLNGTTVVHSADAFISKVADAKVGKTMPTTEWVILCGTLDIFDGSPISP